MNPVSAPAAALAGQGAEIAMGDMTDPASLKRAITGCRAVFHFAAALREHQPLDYYQRVNVEGTRALAEAALDQGVKRFLHTSTISVYGMDLNGVIDETAPHQPSHDPYADTKMEAERVVRKLAAELGLPAVIVQPTQIYGPGDELWTLYPIELIRNGRMMLIDGGVGTIRPIFLDDVVDGILAAARAGDTGEAYILCGPERVTYCDFFGHLARIAGSRLPPSVPGWVANAIAAVMEQAARWTGRAPAFSRREIRHITQRADYSGARARARLDFTPRVTLQEGMQCVQQWLNDATPPTHSST